MNRSRGCQTQINLFRIASSRTHLVMQAYCLTDIDEINPLGIEVWYRTTRRFLILDGIEAIRYRTRYPALGMGIVKVLTVLLLLSILLIDPVL